MSELEELKAYFDKVGVVYEIKERGDCIVLSVDEGAGPKNIGYSGFYTDYVFNLDGSFSRTGAYEW